MNRAKRDPYRAPAYLQLLDRQLEALTSPGVHHVEVRHDHTCAIFATGSSLRCNCNPSVASGPAIDRKYELAWRSQRGRSA